MTVVQWTARIFGWGFVLIALLGFTASGGSMDADLATAPRVFGLFPVNVVHNAIHLVFGLWAMFAYHWPERAKSYATVTGVIYLLLAALGLLAPTFFGLAPIGGNDIWLHAGIGLVLTGVGFSAPGPSAAADEPHVVPATERGATPATTTTASSTEATVTRPPAQPSGTPQHDRPVEPKPAQNEGAAPASPPPSPPEHVVDEPPRQPDDADTEPPPPPDRRRGDAP